MGTDHGKKKDTKKKVKTPLKKPKVIDKIKTQSTKTTVSAAQKRRKKKTSKEDIKFTYVDDPKYRAKPSKKKTSKENFKFITIDDSKYRAKPSKKRKK